MESVFCIPPERACSKGWAVHLFSWSNSKTPFLLPRPAHLARWCQVYLGNERKSLTTNTITQASTMLRIGLVAKVMLIYVHTLTCIYLFKWWFQYAWNCHHITHFTTGINHSISKIIFTYSDCQEIFHYVKFVVFLSKREALVIYDLICYIIILYSGYVCPSSVYYTQPMRAQNTRGQWQLIVQNLSGIQQPMRIEKCL